MEPEIRDKSNDEVLDFEINKAYQAFYDSGKLLGGAFISHILLLCFTILLVFGEGIENEISIPMPLHGRPSQ